jgi:hypothetical protein
MVLALEATGGTMGHLIGDGLAIGVAVASYVIAWTLGRIIRGFRDGDRP